MPYDQVSHDTVAYDHADIIAYAYQRLQWKMEYTNIARNILPIQFSLRQLQNVYELVFKKVFDKRNFRKKILSLGMLVETSEYDTTSSKRPARLYRFSDTDLKIIGIL